MVSLTVREWTVGVGLMTASETPGAEIFAHEAKWTVSATNPGAAAERAYQTTSADVRLQGKTLPKITRVVFSVEKLEGKEGHVR